MCGIFAVSGSCVSAGSEVLAGLKKLEYRGYDSWGIGMRESASGKILIEKEVGKISDIPAKTSKSPKALRSLKHGNIFCETAEAIGHSRWATHGGVTPQNAHPHKVGKVTLVHNGIFENYEAVKREFGGHKFASETDSEVIAVLINDFLEQGKSAPEAIRKAAERIEGRFAILVMIEGEEGIYAARRGSPLIVGKSKNKTFIASDIPAFLQETNVVNYLDDNEMVYVHQTEAYFSDLQSGEPINKRNIEVSWTIQEAEKGEYEHFMLKEIFDQKETIARAINHEDLLLEKAINLLRECNGAYFVACGTAHKVIMAAEYFFSNIAGRKINVVPASEMKSFQQFVHAQTAVVAVSQSGETADILEVLERSKEKGAKILSLTNVESSSVARTSLMHLPINAGPEKAVASTKATTAQMALLLLLAYTDAGKTNQGREILRTASSSINDLLNPRYEDQVRKVAQEIVQHDNMFIIGRDSLYPMALEAAIKIQEVSYIHAQGFPAGELKHGPIALIEKDVPCLVLGDDPETISNAAELKARGAMVIGVSPHKNEVFDLWLRVPDCGAAQPIASIIPVQILAYHLAILRELDPDMPRNLAKSVTVK